MSRAAWPLLGWLLWSHFTFNANDGTPAQDRWDVIGRAPTEASCLAAMATGQSANMRLVDSGPAYRVYTPANLKPGHLSTTRFSCLPETTNPRGIKQ